MKKFLLVFPLAVALQANAQLTITTGLDSLQMSGLLEGLGVDISNVVINCPSVSYGQFSGTSEIPIYNGILLSTGDAGAMGNANTDGSTSYINNAAGDSDLDMMVSPYGTFDACVLEFDAVPSGDTLYFNFAFGSEEYIEYVFSGFNDVFAIFISGPGFAQPTNIALLPNDTIVTINNVNHVVNSQYYIDNETIPGQYIMFDGFTTNILVETVVVPASAYHFKIAIADVGDQVFDSGVMLEAFSFRSTAAPAKVNESEISEPALFPNPANESFFISGLKENGTLRIMNEMGQQVINIPVTGSSVKVETSSLPAGIYFVQFTGTEKTITRKLLVK
ncbi:MAG: choice-of-anchor L domain-containing protein [Bacteroidota bacterium]